MNTLVITRVAERQWHALDDDLVVGRGDATPRPDGRLFLSIDAWHDDVFARLAEAMLTALPRPLYTVVDEADAYVGLARLALLPRHTRIGLIAVRADHRRRGIAHALLAEILAAAHARGVGTVSADVHEANTAAIALFEAVGARRTGSNLELVID